MYCMPPFFNRQFAKVFNQPLSFDTSKVTTMEEMFEVHFARASRSDSSRAFSCPLHARSPPHTNEYFPHQLNIPHTNADIVCPAFGYRQGEDQDDGSAFNQPLSFDTSKVTNMDEMFEVHSPMPCCA